MCTKRTLCIQDMSAIGRCSLTVISPVLSVKGIQCVPLATTVLSSHYGGFGQVARCDLTEFCFDALKQFERIGVGFDCVLSGFLASEKQVELVKNAFAYSPDAVKICDPVMADNGKMYSSVTNAIAEGITQLCYSSDIITPNTTEAAILLGEDCTKQLFTAEEIETTANRLKEKFGCSVVITGAKTADNKVICCVAQKNGETQNVPCNYIPVHFPGTGDLFVAVMTAYILNGKDIVYAVEKACRFVELCVKNTWREDTDTRYGVNLEENLKYLID